MKHLPTLATTLSLLAALAAGPAFAQQPPAAPAPQETLRPEVAPAARAANELLGASKFTEALAKLAEAEAVPNRTPYEDFVLARIRAAASTGAGDLEGAAKAYEAVLATNRLPADEARKIEEGLAGTFYNRKDYDRALVWAERYLKNGGTNVQVRRVVLQSHYLKKDYAAAAREGLVLVKEDEAANRKPTDELLRIVASSQVQTKDDAGYEQSLERLLRWYPRPAYWRDRIGRVQNAANFDDALTIDAYRLMAAAGAMETPNDYVVLAELAQRAALPAEAQAALDAGFAAGKLGTGPDAAKHQAMKTKATQDAAADAKEFDRNLPPSATATANALVNQGIALATAGRAERGLALVEQGLAKPGLARPDAAKLRLAWINAQAGRKAPAQALFKEVQAAGGPAGDLARLWLIRLDQPAQ